MARSSEKARSMLNKFVQLQRHKGAETVNFEDRPPPSEVKNIIEAEDWREKVIQAFTKKMDEIQNGSLGETMIRGLNDELNSLLDEKRGYEQRIKEFGGRDYSTTTDTIDIVDGKRFKLPGSSYMYFGAARNLPGLKELLEVDAKTKKRNVEELYQYVDAEYLGLNEDPDGILEAIEKQRESELRIDISVLDSDSEDEVDELPTQEDIEKSILEKKKALMMKRFVE